MRYGKLENWGMGPDIITKADDLIQNAWEEETPAKRMKLARKALESDLDCIDAYNILGIEAKTQGERIALFAEAVRVGKSLWEPYLNDDEMHWWGFIGTRPFMRALHNLGLAYHECGDLAEAEKAYTELITLNPNDNQGIRCLLMELYFHKPRISDIKKLLKKYPDDSMLDMIMAKIFIKLTPSNMNIDEADFRAIQKRNTHILPMMAGKGPPANKIEFSPYGISVGGADEAAEYCDAYLPHWKNAKKLAPILEAVKKYGKE